MQSFRGDARQRATAMKKQIRHGEEHDREDTSSSSSLSSSSLNGNNSDEEAFINQSNPPTKGGPGHAGKTEQYTAFSPAVRTWKVLVVVAVLSLAFAMTVRSSEKYNKPLDATAEYYGQLSQSSQCPTPIDLKENDVNIGKYILQGDKYGLKAKDPTELWEWMQGSKVDGWGQNYRKGRARIHDFTVQEFLPHVIRKFDENKNKNTNGDNTIHIYESACGVGRKLVTTWDIIREELMKENLNGNSNNEDTPVVVLSGNDYASDSAVAARTIIGNPTVMEPFSGAKLGTICGGVDSSNLSHIPSNSIDIVYTGYVGPLHDPLGFSAKYPNKRNLVRAYRTLCQNAMTQPATATEQERKRYQEAQEQVQRMVQIQEDWYAKWVGEMIRIAKPGSPVLIEEVPLPFCEDMYDNGGVNRDFWSRAVAAAMTNDNDNTSNYPSSWGQVDPDSIHFMDVTKTEQKTYVAMMNRYHVAMMKKN